MAEALDELAYRTDRPRGWLVKEAVGAYLAEEAEKDRLTRIALASVDAGDVIPHEEVVKELEAIEAGKLALEGIQARAVYDFGQAPDVELGSKQHLARVV